MSGWVKEGSKESGGEGCVRGRMGKKERRRSTTKGNNKHDAKTPGERNALAFTRQGSHYLDATARGCGAVTDG